MAINVADELKKVYRSLRYRAFKLQEDSGYIDEDEIKDLVQQTCLKCIEKQDQFRGTSFYMWSRGILDRLYIDKYRRLKSQIKAVTEMEQSIKSYNDPDKAYQHPDIAQEVWVKIKYEECLKKLTKKQFRVFYLQMSGVNPETNQPLKQSSLSKALNIPLGTLKPLLVRAKKALGECLKEKMQPTEGMA